MNNQQDTWTNNYGLLYDIVNSPDDGGWYAQRWSDNKISKVFLTRSDLLEALRVDLKKVEFTE